jgi:DNA helicase HerA-like ATPase
MIYEKSLDLWRKDRLRANQPYDNTPEESELREEGFLWLATLELMREDNQNKSYVDQFEPLEKPQYIGNPIHVDTLSEQFKPQPFNVDVSELMRTGVFVTGTRQSGKTVLAKHIVTRLLSENIIVYVVDPTQAWNDIGFPVVSISQPEGKQVIGWLERSTLFDVSQLSPIWQQKFIELFSQAILSVAIQRGKQHFPRTVVVFEEAHTPLPNFILNSKNFTETKRLITQGANFNVSFIAITQFSSMVDKLPVKAAQQRYFGKTSEPNDIKYLKAYLGENVKQLPSLPVGQFLYVHSGRLARMQTTRYQATQATPFYVCQS